MRRMPISNFIKYKENQSSTLLEFVKCLSLLLLIVISISCNEEAIENPDPNPEPNSEIPTIVPNGDENYLTMDSDYIFDQEALHTFDLRILSHDLERLNNDPAAEQYVEGMLIFEGDTISPVGVRYKGSIGGFVGCVSGSNWFEPSGRKTCTKLSMKVKINWEDREEEFFKLKKLQFHSQNNDQSQMHDRLGYWLFREMGVPAPRSVHAKLNINGVYNGLFALTEQIDGRFVKHNFDDDEGNVYKEVWPLKMNGSATGQQEYINALKTNEDESPSVEIIQNFGYRIENADENELQDIISSTMDIDEILSLIAVDRTIRHDDGPFHWYCSGSNCSNHNYYWVEEPNNEKLHLIPWDLDNAFENIISNANQVTPIPDDFGQTSNDCEPFSYGWLGLKQWSASCDKLTAGWASFNEEYQEKRSTLKNGPLSEAIVSQKLETWADQIRIATQEASEINNDAISLDDWDSAIEDLKEQLAFARNN